MQLLEPASTFDDPPVPVYEFRLGELVDVDSYPFSV